MKRLRPKQVPCTPVGKAMGLSRHDFTFLCFGTWDGLWLGYRETLCRDAITFQWERIYLTQLEPGQSTMEYNLLQQMI